MSASLAAPASTLPAQEGQAPPLSAPEFASKGLLRRRRCAVVAFVFCCAAVALAVGLGVGLTLGAAPAPLATTVLAQVAVPYMNCLSLTLGVGGVEAALLAAAAAAAGGNAVAQVRACATTGAPSGARRAQAALLGSSCATLAAQPAPFKSLLTVAITCYGAGNACGVAALASLGASLYAGGASTNASLATAFALIASCTGVAANPALAVVGVAPPALTLTGVAPTPSPTPAVPSSTPSGTATAPATPSATAQTCGADGAYVGDQQPPPGFCSCVTINGYASFIEGWSNSGIGGGVPLSVCCSGLCCPDGTCVSNLGNC